MRDGHIAGKGWVWNEVLGRGTQRSFDVKCPVRDRRSATWRYDSAIQLAKKTFQHQGFSNIDISFSVRKM
jgi:hypothetical protein